MMRYTESIGYDARLALFDIEGSIAHVRGLGQSGILPTGESELLIATLAQVGEEFRSHRFVLLPEDEDIHTAIERRVTEIAGEVGAKVHTGRSRNDQVATALRLYTRSAIHELIGGLVGVERALYDRAVEVGAHYLPGYTHLQRAQPILLAHQLLAHGWALARDIDRLVATLGRMDVCPLGAGALGGSSLPLDPAFVARELHFSRAFSNSLDAVSDRDFVAETLFDLALLGVHLSRLGEEIVIFSSEEFGFYRLDDAWSTGSSMLPQKKNPDIAELARGKTGRLIGHLAGFLSTLKSLPLAYNRDLQEDKEPLFDAIDETRRALPAISGLIRSITFQTDRMEIAADGETMVAIDLAEFLVAQGMPFRQAHGVIGALVRRSLDEGRSLRELVVAEPSLGDPALSLFIEGSSVQRRKSAGGGGVGQIEAQLEDYLAVLKEHEARIQ
jgi:argininosuccinate lyase